MRKIDVKMSLNCIGNEGEYFVMYEHLKRTDTDKENAYVCLWFSDNAEPDIMFYVGEGNAQDYLDDMFKCIRRSTMKIV